MIVGRPSELHCHTKSLVYTHASSSVVGDAMSQVFMKDILILGHDLTSSGVWNSLSQYLLGVAGVT